MFKLNLMTEIGGKISRSEFLLNRFVMYMTFTIFHILIHICTVDLSKILKHEPIFLNTKGFMDAVQFYS